MTRAGAALLAILALAAALRLYGIDYGLDLRVPERAVLVDQIDEEGMVIAVRDHFLRGDLHPGAFVHWGSVGFLAFGAIDFCVLEARALLGHGDLATQLDALKSAPSLLHLVHRLAVIAAALASIFVVYRLARREFTVRVALAAAALLATCYLHVRVSHAGTLDVLLGLWLALVADASLALRRDWTRRRAIGAFALVAIAALTKFYGAVSVLLPLGAALSHWRRHEPARARVVRDVASAIACAAVVAVVLATPIFVGFDDFRTATQNQSATIGFRAGAVLDVIAFHARRTLGVGAGIAACVFAAIGLLALLRGARNGGDRFAAFVFVTPFLLLVATANQVPRYGASVMPFVALLAALGASALVSPRLARSSLGFALVVVLAALPPLARSAAYGRLLSRPDTRLDVTDRLRAANARPDDVLAFGIYGLPRWSLTQCAPPFLDFLGLVYLKRTATAESLLARTPRFVIHEESAYIEGSPLDLDTLGFDEWRRRRGAEYREVLRVDGRVDPSDRFYPEEGTGEPEHLIPFDRPWRMERPGPVIVLFERIAPG